MSGNDDFNLHMNATVIEEMKSIDRQNKQIILTIQNLGCSIYKKVGGVGYAKGGHMFGKAFISLAIKETIVSLSFHVQMS